MKRKKGWPSDSPQDVPLTTEHLFNSPGTGSTSFLHLPVRVHNGVKCAYEFVEKF